jgi:feruloyl-CoA synthase
MKPVRKINLGPRRALLDRAAGGDLLLRSPQPLGPYPARLTDRLVEWARAAPERIFLAKRDPAEAWRTVTYAQALDLVRRIGQGLLDRGLSADRPIVILSGNDLEHALLGLAALHVGVLYAPISPAYSMVATDYAKLRHAVGLMSPGLVFAANGERFAAALEAVLPAEAELVVTEAPPKGRAATLFAALMATAPSEAVERAHAAIGPDGAAKILFTSGSTGMPKGVINTQRMLSSNQQMLIEAMPVIGEAPPVIVDWLPWHHTFGGNHNVGLVLYNGGSLYIDDGKPMPGLIEPSVKNLREIAPTLYFNVPKGFEALIPYLRREPALREKFFSRLAMLFYAAAGLPQHIWDALDELAVEACGERILMITGLGATETAPFAICANWEGARSGMIGLPVPGQELKLTPVGDKLEARVRGPNVTPGYWRNREATAAAFDAEGWYCMGDAVRFVDPADPQKGLMFDGRLAEDFKLSTGTWVSVGPLKARLIRHCAPLVLDLVLAAPDRDEVTALIVADIAACRAACHGLPPEASERELLQSPALRARFQALLEAFAAEAGGGASRIARAVILEEPPSMLANELTDKGSLNARAVLAHRAALVEALYAEQPPPHVIVVNRGRRAHVA